MALGKTTYFEGLVITYLKSLGTLYVGLCVGNPDGAGAEVDSGSHAEYVRKEITLGTTSGGNPTVCSNSNTITFATALGSWGTVTHWGIYDAETSGHRLYTGTLTTPSSIAVTVGVRPTFDVGTLIVSED